MRSWNRYWFRDGGRTSAAILRIAIGTSILWMLWRLQPGYAGSPEAAPHDRYSPVGVLRLLPFEPGPTTFAIVWPIAWAATIAMIAGAWSRAATAISFAAALVIASYEYSFKDTWSHDNNAPLLAQFAFLGARGGDALSVDAWLRRRRGRDLPADVQYMWSVLLVQLMLGLMMASAAFSKLASGGSSLSWIFSDNLRNHILVRFDLNDMPRPALADWIVAEPWRWKAAALLNVLAQLAPLAACLAVRRPLLRLMFGMVFAIETVLLDLVMGFPNHHWLPLAVVFVDWEWVLAKFRRREPQLLSPPRARWFVAALLAVDVVIAFWRWPKIDQKIGAYPLSNFPMFASIRAQRPYSEHHPYDIPGRRDVALELDPPAPQLAQWMTDEARALADALQDPTRIEGEMKAMVERMRRKWPELPLKAVRANLVVLRAPAYPAPARIDRVPLAALGELRDGVFTTALGRDPVGRVAYYKDGEYLDPSDHIPTGAELVTRVDDRWFLLGTLP